MEWIHCNNCFGLPDSEKNFYLTSCGHIYCQDCEEQCARTQCKLCGNQCSTIVLSSTLKPDVQMYFTDPDELLKKKLKEVHQVSDFQKNHRARLWAHQKKQFISLKPILIFISYIKHVIKVPCRINSEIIMSCSAKQNYV
ncbi:RING finger protein 212 [Trichonephila inaurata madagascariensis]|uniref:RING finger protein 212 n=1 Tax=Trichonephila inaurata madagascariensis TaxID=2747483 RepID=A0A8X6YFK2_9ARAC|nr:RING finger protein 212 [Trichonephila inaurata madagascariensis]